VRARLGFILVGIVVALVLSATGAWTSLRRLLASWLARIGLVTSTALLCAALLSASAQLAFASSPTQLSPRVAAISKSREGKLAQKKLESVITAPSVATLSKALLTQGGTELTTFQRTF
jgi:hypothetical protein